MIIVDRLEAAETTIIAGSLATWWLGRNDRELHQDWTLANP